MFAITAVLLLGLIYFAGPKVFPKQTSPLSPTSAPTVLGVQTSPTPLASPSAMTNNSDLSPIPIDNLDPKTMTAPPPMEIDKNKQYLALLKTSAGDITIALDALHTPLTVNNFVFLAGHHFYDHTIFHRVIKDFMIQGGDPKGDGTGGPGYKFADETFTGEYTRGTVAMANSGPDTNGSQFFIMHQDTALPKNYVIFGHVTAGLDVVDKIATAPVQMSPSGENSQPVNPVTVSSVMISAE